MITDENYLSPEALAKKLVRHHELQKLITEWNSGERDSSFISCFEHYVEAVQLDRRMREEICDVLDTARFPQLVEGAMQVLLNPTIRTSFESGLRRCLNEWSLRVVRDAELKSRAPAPFLDGAAWVEWCVLHAKRPTLCTPQGDDLVSPILEETLLKEALREASRFAVELGWIGSTHGE